MRAYKAEEIPSEPLYDLFLSALRKPPADRREDLDPHQGSCEQFVDEGAILVTKLAERQPKFVGGGALGGERRRERQLITIER